MGGGGTAGERIAGGNCDLGGQTGQALDRLGLLPEHLALTLEEMGRWGATLAKVVMAVAPREPAEEIEHLGLHTVAPKDPSLASRPERLLLQLARPPHEGQGHGPRKTQCRRWERPEREGGVAARDNALPRPSRRTVIIATKSRRCR